MHNSYATLLYITFLTGTVTHTGCFTMLWCLIDDQVVNIIHGFKGPGRHIDSVYRLLHIKLHFLHLYTTKDA